MIRKHPEIKRLFGNTPSTAFWCIAFASAQIALAVGLSSQPWWVFLLAAWAIGSWIDVNLFQLAHECNHNPCFQENNAKPLALYIHRHFPCLCPDTMHGGLNTTFTIMTLERKRTLSPVGEQPFF
jgi:hypothetical protein